MRARFTLALVLSCGLAGPAAALGSWAGTRDFAFGRGGIATVDVVPGASVHGTDVLVQSGRRILAAGYAEAAQGGTRALVAGLLGDGRLDTSYGTGGVVLLDAVAATAGPPARVRLLPLADGRTLVLGGGLARLDADGHLDAGFGDGAGAARLPAGFVPGGARVMSDGRIVVVGGRPEGDAVAGAVVRLTAEGLPDLSFGENGMAVLPVGGTASDGKPAGTTGLTGAAVTADASVYAAGPAQDTSFSGFGPVVIARLTPAGVLDPSFGDGGRTVLYGPSGLNGESVQLGLDGGVVIGGWEGHLHAGAGPSIEAVPPSGRAGSALSVYAGADGVSLLPLVTGGWLWSTAFGRSLNLYRFADGAPELGVDETGRDDFIYGESVTRLPDGVTASGPVALQADGKILVAGSSTGSGGLSRLAAIRVFGLAERPIAKMVVTAPRATTTRLAAAVPMFCPLRRCRGIGELRAGGKPLARGPFDMAAGGLAPLVLTWTRPGRRPARATLTIRLEDGEPTTLDVALHRAATAPPPDQPFGALRPLAGAVAAFATDRRRSLVYVQSRRIHLLDARTQRRYAVPAPTTCASPVLDVSFPVVLVRCGQRPWLVDVRTRAVRRLPRSSPALGRFWLGPLPRRCKVQIERTHCDQYLAWRTGRTRTLREHDYQSENVPHDLDSPQLADVRACPPVESPVRAFSVLVDGLYEYPYVLLTFTSDPWTDPRFGLFVAHCSVPGGDAQRRELSDNPIGPQLGSGLATWATKGTADVFAYAVRSRRLTHWTAPGGDAAVLDPARIAPTRDAVFVAAAARETCTNTIDCVSHSWTLSQARRRR